jgi:hypothetical protein
VRVAAPPGKSVMLFKRSTELALVGSVLQSHSCQVERPSFNPTAAKASTRRQPYVLSGDDPHGCDVRSNKASMRSTCPFSAGCAESTSATAPAVCGPAMLVPL